LPEVICLGEVLMDMLPDREGANWSDISSFSPIPGGSPANVSVGLAKLGVEVGFVGKVGEDPFGKILVDVLRKNGVDVSQVKFDSNVRTTLAFVSIHKKGENDFVFYRNPGADMMLSPEEVNEDYIAKSKFLHFGSLSITAEPCYSATLQAIRFAREHRVFVSFDPNLRPRLWKDLKEAKKRIIECLKYAYLAKMNNEELKFTADTDDLTKGTSWLLQKGPKVVVITQGGEGSFLCTKQTSAFFPAYKVKVADTVGCGDAFTAAIIHQLLFLKKKGEDISKLDEIKAKDILKYANAAAALTATKKGVIPSLPTKNEVEEFLKKQEQKDHV